MENTPMVIPVLVPPTGYPPGGQPKTNIKI